MMAIAANLPTLVKALVYLKGEISLDDILSGGKGEDDKGKSKRHPVGRTQ